MKKIYKFLLLLLLAFLSNACQLPLLTDGVDETNDKANITPATIETAVRAPSIEVSPIKPGEGNYKVISGTNLRVRVTAPGANEVEILYRPVTTENRFVKLKTLNEPSDPGGNRFELELATPQDFNGEVWARVRYQNGEVKETQHLHLVMTSSPEKKNANPLAETGSAIEGTANQASDDNESARSDSKTGGRIERMALQSGAGGIRITLNVPAFLLTVWQGDKEIKTFYVGVGRRTFPIPTGIRTADKIILNPDWVPPDSEWVRASGIEPYKRIPASSPFNPLGNIKIPLGEAYLLHEAQGVSDIGNLVSHGCVRVLRDDLFAITRMIVQGHGLPISTKEINAARKDSKRRVINLGEEMIVDINYDTMVVEGKILTIYPDVYEHKTNTVENLREEVEHYRIDVSKLEEASLKKMLGRVNSKRKFVVPLAEISKGQGLKMGKTIPLTPFQAKNAHTASAW